MIRGTFVNTFDSAEALGREGYKVLDHFLIVFSRWEIVAHAKL